MNSASTALMMIPLIFLMPLQSGRPELPVDPSPAGQGQASAITLPQVLERILLNNPELEAAEHTAEAAAARIVQARLRPNPEISATAEQFGSRGPVGFWGLLESDIQVSQRIELGNKRPLRVRSAEADLALARQGLEARRSELLWGASLAFLEAISAQERVKNRQELYRLAEQTQLLVAERVAAGRVSPVEGTRAAASLASARLELDRSIRESEARRDWLAGLWGGSGSEIAAVAGLFEIPPAPAGLHESCLDNNPELQVASAAIDAQRAQLELERAVGKPDLTVSAGYRYLSLEGQSTWTAGISIPMPFSDRRQGAVAEQRSLLARAQSERDALERRLRFALQQARHDHDLAATTAETLRRLALPAAREAAAALEEGYRLGKFDYLQVLDAARTLAEYQSQYIESVAAGMKAALEIQRLSSCTAAEIPPDNGAGRKESDHAK